MTTGNQIVLALRALKLSGMADALEQQFVGSGWREAAFEERLEHLITEERWRPPETGLALTKAA